MADSATTATLIVNLLTGCHWAGHQLHGGIRYVPVASILMKSLCTRGGGYGKAERGCWRSQDSIADSSTTAVPILDPLLERRQARRQLPAGIRYISGTSESIEFAFLLRVGFFCNKS